LVNAGWTSPSGAIIGHSQSNCACTFHFARAGDGDRARRAQELTEIIAARPLMSLRAVMHFPFERAGFNR